MEREFVPYEIALELKELGFNEPCMKGYTEEYKTLISFSNTHTNTSVEKTLPTKPLTAPLYQQAFRWFREKYGCEFHIECRRHTSVKYYEVFLFDGNKSVTVFGKSLTYKEAELECLKKLIEIAKQK